MSDEPIEEYLDDVYARLRGDPRAGRRLLDEAADHLHGAAAELERAGMDRIAAEREAVRRFGASRPLVRAHERRSFVRLSLDTIQASAFLAATGLVAVGLSGLLAAAMSAAFGRAFVGAQLPNWIGHPASVAENAHDAVALRVLAGLIGLVALAALLAVRWARPNMRLRVLPPAYVDVTALVAFGGATVALGAASIDQLVNHAGHGTGFFLSGAIVSLLGAAVFGVRAVRDLLLSRAS